MERGYVAIVISLISVAMAGFAVLIAYTERDAPMQALLLESQLSDVAKLVESARFGCNSYLCERDDAKHDVCKRDQLDTAFGNFEDSRQRLALTASSGLMGVIVGLEKIHDHHALYRGADIDDWMLKRWKNDVHQIEFMKSSLCEREMDNITNELRKALGVEQFSSGLMARFGDSAKRRQEAIATKSH